MLEAVLDRSLLRSRQVALEHAQILFLLAHVGLHERVEADEQAAQAKRSAANTSATIR